MTQKSKKAWNITVNVIVSIIVIFVLILTVNIIASGKKGYVNLFGYTHVAVLSDSMEGDQSDNFEKGDLLRVKILSDNEKKELKEGDIITFYQEATADSPSGNFVVIDGKTYFINSHRIIKIDGQRLYTQGDNNTVQDPLYRSYSDVIGKVVSHVDGLGYVSMWFQSQTGFFVCVVLPSLLIVVYCIFNLVKVILERNKEVAGDKEEKLKQELLEQLRAEGKLVEGAESGNAAPAAPVAPLPAESESASPVVPLPKEPEPEPVAQPAAESAETESKAEEPKPAAKKAPAKKKQPIILSAEPEAESAETESKAEEPKPAAKKAPAKRKQPVILSAEPEAESAETESKAEEPKPAAKKAPAKKKQPVILSAEPEAEGAETAKPKSAPKTKKSSGAAKSSDDAK